MKRVFTSLCALLAMAFIVLVQVSPASADPDWSSVTYVTTPTFEPVHEMRWKSTLVASNPQGQFVAIWSRTQNGSLMVQSSTSTDGVNWSSPINLSAGGYNSFRSAVSVTSDGKFIAIWRMVETGVARVFMASSSDGMNWSAPIALSSTVYDAFSPSVTSDESGRTLVAWSTHFGLRYHIEVVTSDDLTHWSSPQRITQLNPNENSPKVVATSEHGFALMYYSTDSQWQRVVATTSPEGTNWTAPTYVSDASENAYSPSIATASSGEFIIGWSESDVTYTSLSINGNFSGTPLRHSSNSCIANSSILSSSPSGLLEMMWFCIDSPNRTVEVTSSIDGNSWSIPQNVYTTTGDIREPRIIIGDNGEAVATWNLQMNQDYSVESVAKAPGQEWSASHTLSTTSFMSWGSSLATNSRGVILAMWDEAAVSDWQVSSSVFSYELPPSSSVPVNPPPVTPVLAETGNGSLANLAVAISVIACGIALLLAQVSLQKQNRNC